MEKYEIIIKENGEEKETINAEGFCLFTVSNGKIGGKALLPNATGCTVMTLISALQEIIDSMWNQIGVDSEKERKRLLMFNELMGKVKSDEEGKQ